MPFVERLVCSRCGRKYEAETKELLCSTRDNGKLDVKYDYNSIAEIITRRELDRRPAGLWKFFELLPLMEQRRIVTLGEGGTPLIEAKRLGNKLAFKSLYVKDDTKNPTASFKDRPMTVGVSKAIELGFKTLVSASSGNAAAALSAYCAKAGLRCYTFVPETASMGKIAQLTLYGATVLRFRGLEKGEDPTVKMLRVMHEKYGWYTCPSFGPFNPYQAEGPKTMSYEIVEQLRWIVPDWVIVPVGAGGLLGGNWKGFVELETLGLIDRKPKTVAVQSDGCAPVVRAFKQGKGPFEIEPWEKPDSIATGLMDPLPWDGDAALNAIRESGGTAVSVSNNEILEVQKALAQSEGIFGEPSGVTSLAGLVKLADQGVIDRSDTIVVEVTGSGLKDPAAAMTGMVEPPVLNADLDEVRKVLGLS